MTNRPTTEQFFAYAMKDDAQAVAFVMQLCQVLHLWDDLQDRDKPIARIDIDRGMYLALVAIPRNAFYREYFDELNPLLANAIFNWHCANDLEAEDTEDGKRIAFVIRSAYADIALTAARICGGYDWARQIAPELRRRWHGEGYAGYLENLEKQRASAKELGNEHVLQ